MLLLGQCSGADTVCQAVNVSVAQAPGNNYCIFKVYRGSLQLSNYLQLLVIDFLIRGVALSVWMQINPADHEECVSGNLCLL